MGVPLGSSAAELTIWIKEVATMTELIRTHRTHERHLNHIHLSAPWTSLENGHAECVQAFLETGRRREPDQPAGSRQHGMGVCDTRPVSTTLGYFCVYLLLLLIFILKFIL